MFVKIIFSKCICLLPTFPWQAHLYLCIMCLSRYNHHLWSFPHIWYWLSSRWIPLLRFSYYFSISLYIFGLHFPMFHCHSFSPCWILHNSLISSLVLKLLTFQFHENCLIWTLLYIWIKDGFWWLANPPIRFLLSHLIWIIQYKPRPCYLMNQE